jgi:hypothetical protein
VAPEVLAIAPRATRIAPEPKLIEPEPAVARGKRPSPETTVGPMEPANSPPLAITEKPRPEAGANLPATEKPEPMAEHFGTRIDFSATPALAYERAKKEKDKLVMLLHFPGSFDKGAFTCEAAESLRADALLDDEVTGFVNENFLCSHQRIGALRSVKGVQTGGSVVTYFCLADGTVLHAIPGAVDAKQFMQEARWVVDIRQSAQQKMQKDTSRYNWLVKRAHSERYFDEFVPPNDPFGGVMIPGKFPPPPPRLGGFGGFPPLGGGIGNPLMPVMPTSNKLPAQRPANQPPQVQVHWLLATRTAPKINDIYKIVYEQILKERITDR